MVNINEVFASLKHADSVLKGNILGLTLHLSHVNDLKAACFCDMWFYPFLCHIKNLKSCEKKPTLNSSLCESQQTALRW